MLAKLLVLVLKYVEQFMSLGPFLKSLFKKDGSRSRSTSLRRRLSRYSPEPITVKSEKGESHHQQQTIERIKSAFERYLKHTRGLADSTHELSSILCNRQYLGEQDRVALENCGEIYKKGFRHREALQIIAQIDACMSDMQNLQRNSLERDAFKEEELYYKGKLERLGPASSSRKQRNLDKYERVKQQRQKQEYGNIKLENHARGSFKDQRRWFSKVVEHLCRDISVLSSAYTMAFDEVADSGSSRSTTPVWNSAAYGRGRNTSASRRSRSQPSSTRSSTSKSSTFQFPSTGETWESGSRPITNKFPSTSAKPFPSTEYTNQLRGKPSGYPDLDTCLFPLTDA